MPTASWWACYAAWAAASVGVAMRINRTVGEPYMGLVIAMFPLVQWWSWLFYTDMASVVCILLCWRTALQQRHVQSALLGAISLLFRQTNIVWIAFIAAQAAIRELELPKKEVKLAGGKATPFAVARVALAQLPTLAPVIAAYLPVFLAFLAFIRWNGGIVLGDKQNHVATVHVAQLYYLVAFAGVLFWPVIVTPRRVRVACYELIGSPRRAMLSLLALAVICYTIKHYTIAHPFLLADNRHFCFYLWRRVINLRWWTRYALSPGYLLAGRLIYDQLAAFYLAIQAACVWLFLEKPFVWDIQVGEDGKGLEGRDEREVGRLQRFMW
ncbi:Glycosyltransferase family 59 protein [Rhodotorula toruloides ATCC 204091]|uniref:Dol-P-Glc:Glc(2)Man(9)GlcNAc(2)-PP-Dol alpha-1,2-glucosyltransferase n=1 Tax=Rhodotorula toruloides TaxID=5286 RepID=A0A0K3CQX5_RHOTO|nr:Glycosyltransferase family 59 protein [Rhodotorula toruloides ATCC 204091]